MKLEGAQKIAAEVIKRLSPYCEKIEVAGSIRRRKSIVHDIDLVLIPFDPWNLESEVLALAHPLKPKMSGEKLKRLDYCGAQIDLYYASPETWSTLLLIRTGSKENNIRLCRRAKDLGRHLAANGDGLFDGTGKRIAGDTEISIYNALGLPYQPPWERK